MAETDITPVELTTNTASADLPDASGTAASTPADGWNVQVGSLGRPRILMKFVSVTSTDTVTVEAGDKPPAELAGLGGLDISLAADDVKYVVVEGGRFMRSDGTILVTCTAGSTLMEAFLLPI